MPLKLVRGKGRTSDQEYQELSDFRCRMRWSKYSPFPDPESRKEAWMAHREELIAASIRDRPGCRPAAFWHYDLPGIDDLRRATQWEYLIQAGHCDRDEIDRIYLQWEEHLDHFGQLLADHGWAPPNGLTLADYQRQAAIFDRHGYYASNHLRRATGRTAFNKMVAFLLKSEGKD